MASNKADFDARANQAWTTLQNGLKETDADRNLSPQGKQEKAGRLLATYQAAIAQIQDEARSWAKSERKTALLALSLEQAREIKQLRADVGDVLAAAIIRERLEASTSADIQATHESVKDDAWGRAVVGNYGRLIVNRRAGERPKPDDLLALEAMKPKRYSSDVEHEKVLADLEPKRFESWAEDLDRGARAQHMATTYGVSAAHVPLPVPGDPLN